MTESHLTVPPGAGRQIVETGSLLACPLLGTNQFIKFCLARGLKINRERLIRLERLGLFAPVFRVRTPKKLSAPFDIPLREGNNWFSKSWAIDTTEVPGTHDVPDHTDMTREGYYSIFQIDHLRIVLSGLTLDVHLDSYLAQPTGESIDWKRAGDRWIEFAEACAAGLRDHHYRRAVALLCQHISNRYFPETQTDMRTIQISGGHSSDQWIVIRSHGWDWENEVPLWDPRRTAKLYRLTPEKLFHAYRGLAMDQAHCDPIERWYQLTQFISVHERAKLKGAALLAETLRAGAHMLRLLNKDLYNEELPQPNEVRGTIIHHFPELDARRDVRRHLEFVANRFGVNPQPRLSLIVEGPTEEVVVLKIFEEYFGANPGAYGIEIVVLGGVDFATGGKGDRFRAIMRLIDYLHHHQTFAFLLLDNENYATRLKVNSKKMRSIHRRDRYVTRPEYIQIWNASFEFDNFSDTEIAAALNEQVNGSATFTRNEILNVRNQNKPGSALEGLYCQKTNYGLQKVRLSEILIQNMLAPSTRRNIESRPIIKILNRIAVLAARNHLPTSQRSKDANQASRFLRMKPRPQSLKRKVIPS